MPFKVETEVEWVPHEVLGSHQIYQIYSSTKYAIYFTGTDVTLYKRSDSTLWTYDGFGYTLLELIESPHLPHEVVIEIIFNLDYFIKL